MDSIRAIEVNFAEPVELTQQDQQELVALLSRICDRYEGRHPDRVMWPFGIGFKMLANPLMLSDDEPMPFDESIFSIECAERENYDWPCATCGKKQDEHDHVTADPTAGNCKFVPALKLQAERAKGSA